MSRAETDVAPEEYPEEYSGVNEYSVGLWFRWLEIGRVPWEVIYSLTSNEPDVRTNIEKAGDRLLSLY